MENIDTQKVNVIRDFAEKRTAHLENPTTESMAALRDAKTACLRVWRSDLEGMKLEIEKVMRHEQYEHMKKYAVPAKDPVDFLNRYTRAGYGIERGEEYQKSRIESEYEDLEKFGYCMIPPSSSKTGEIVTWYPDNSAP